LDQVVSAILRAAKRIGFTHIGGFTKLPIVAEERSDTDSGWLANSLWSSRGINGLLTGHLRREKQFILSTRKAFRKGFKEPITVRRCKARWADCPRETLPGQQDQLIAALQNQLAGNGTSVAQQQLQQATQQNQLNTAGQLASVRGLNPATAARLIAQNQAGIQQQAASQGGLLRAQETQNNLGALSTALQNQGALNVANQNATTNRISTLGGLQGNQNNLILNNKLGSAQIDAGVAAANQKAANDLTGGILGGLASAGAAAVGANKGGMAVQGGFAGTQGDFNSKPRRHVRR